MTPADKALVRRYADWWRAESWDKGRSLARATDRPTTTRARDFAWEFAERGIPAGLPDRYARFRVRRDRGPGRVGKTKGGDEGRATA